MPGTKAGGLKAAKTNLKNNPNFYKEIGRKGGKNGHTGGFYNDPERAKICGAKGGRKSKRGPAKPKVVSSKEEADRLRKAIEEIEKSEPKKLTEYEQMSMRRSLFKRIFKH